LSVVSGQPKDSFGSLIVLHIYYHLTRVHCQSRYGGSMCPSLISWVTTCTKAYKNPKMCGEIKNVPLKWLDEICLEYQVSTTHLRRLRKLSFGAETELVHRARCVTASACRATGGRMRATARHSIPRIRRSRMRTCSTVGKGGELTCQGARARGTEELCGARWVHSSNATLAV
jgi:hypothetical protein